MQAKESLRVFVLTIHGKDHPRVKSAAQQLDLAAFPFEFVHGVRPDDREMSDLYSKTANLFLMKRSLSEGEICCYAGHRRMWAQFLSSGASHALFLEDDFAFIDSKKVVNAINDSVLSSANWDVIKLFDYQPKNVIASRTEGQTEFVAYKYPASGTVAYIMNRKGAESLLKRKKIFRPVDEDMSHMWEFGIRIWSVLPNPVSEISPDLGGSTIEPDRIKVTLRKSLLRSIWGNFLKADKQIRSRIYRRHMKI